MLKTLSIIAALLPSAVLASPHQCLLPHAGVDRPGMVSGGIAKAVQSDGENYYWDADGTVVHLTAGPAFIMCADGDNVMFDIRGTVYVASVKMASVACPSGRVGVSAWANHETVGLSICSR